MPDRKERLPEQQGEMILRRCPKCAAFARRSDRLVGLRDGKPVTLYECEQCGELTWDD
jgi:uncharacterized Zn finger protein